MCQVGKEEVRRCCKESRCRCMNKGDLMLDQKILVGGNYQHQAQGVITELIYLLQEVEMV